MPLNRIRCLILGEKCRTNMIHWNIFLICMIFCAGRTVQAQLRPLIKAIDEVEVIAGPSLVSLRGNSWEANKVTKIGFSAGVGLQFLRKNNFSIGSNFLFERKGVKHRYETFYYDPNEKVGNVESIFHFDYITFSPLIRYFPGRKTRFYTEFSPFAAYIIKAQQIINREYNNTRQINERIDFYKRGDWGFKFGTGMTVPLCEKSSLNICLQYNLGLLSIQKDATDRTENRSVALLTSITFK